MGTFPQSVSQAWPGLRAQAKASEPWAGVGDTRERCLPPSLPVYLSLPRFPLAPLVLFAHWPLCSSQWVPQKWGAFSFHPWGAGRLCPAPAPGQCLLPEPRHRNLPGARPRLPLVLPIY